MPVGARRCETDHGTLRRAPELGVPRSTMSKGAKAKPAKAKAVKAKPAKAKAVKARPAGLVTPARARRASCRHPRAS